MVSQLHSTAKAKLRERFMSELEVSEKTNPVILPARYLLQCTTHRCMKTSMEQAQRECGQISSQTNYNRERGAEGERFS